MMYGVAQILLSECMVDRVLVLCPSTISANKLIKRFQGLSANDKLASHLPESVTNKNPRVIPSVESMGEEDICITDVRSVCEYIGVT